MMWAAQKQGRPGARGQGQWTFSWVGALWLRLPGRRSSIADLLTSRNQESGFLCRDFHIIKVQFVKNLQHTWKGISFPSACK